MLLTTKKCRRLAILILANLVLFTTCILGYWYNISSIRHSQVENLRALRVDEFNKIYLYLLTSKNEASENIDIIAENIELDINNSFSDLSLLKEEFMNNDYSSVYPILVDNVKDKFFCGVENGDNDIFVATLDNIIVDFSYDNNSFHDDSEFELKSWESVIASNYNKGLSENALKQILNKSRNIIMVERKKSNIKDHTYITEPTYDNLMNVYLNEGIDGLKNYTILVPAYITDGGDIFGTEDFDMGVRKKNYKFIIVQEFNIYDQIQKNYPELFDNSSETQIKNDRDIMKVSYLLGIVFIISYIVSLILLMSVFNIIISLNSSMKK